MDVTIRPARPEEYEKLGELVAGAYLGDGLLTYGEDDEYLPELRDAAGRAAGAELFAAADAADGELLGTVTFAAHGSPYSEIGAPGEAEFRMLGVAPAARGRGVGAALVAACVERARELGLRRLVLSTLPEMRTAHRLYGRLGFIRTPGRDWEPVPGMVLWAFVRDL